MTAPEIVTGTRDQLAAAFARGFERAAAIAIRARGRFACAVPGGSVATAFLPALVDAAVDWPRVDVFWVDERAVPPADEASNYALAARLWLRRVRLESTRIHRMRGEARDLEEAARAYSLELIGALGMPPVIDMVVLGVGTDGHVASLFPGLSPSAEPEGFVAVVRDAPKPPPERLTLTEATLMAARTICMAGFEPEKAAIMAAALKAPDPGSPVPAARLIAAHPAVTVMFTRAGLSGPDGLSGAADL